MHMPVPTANLPRPISAWHHLLAFLMYLALGRLGLLFAIEPGFGSPIFPAAGLAVAAMVWSRGRLWPAVAMASLVLNLSRSGAPWEWTGTDFLAALGIGIGATLQAGLAAVGVNRLVIQGLHRLESEGLILRAVLLAGPLACAVSATVGTAALFATGVIPSHELAQTWLFWWLGDALGVVVVTPLSFAIIYRKRRPWAGRLKHLGLPMVAALGGVMVAYIAASRWEQIRQQDLVESHGEKIAHLLENRFVAHREVVAALARLVEVTPNMTYEQFDHFTRNTLEKNTDLFALSVNPYVTQVHRSEFERHTANLLDMPGFSIKDRDANKQLVPAAVRPVHVPVAYISPLQPNKAAIGFDILSEPVRRTAIEQALASNNLAITEPIQLVQDNATQPGLLLLEPAHTNHLHGHGAPVLDTPVSGFAVGVVKLGDMLRIATAGATVDGLDFQLIDSMAPAHKALIYRSNPEAIPDNTAWQRSLMVANRIWKLQVYPSADYTRQVHAWTAAGVVFGGLLLTGMLQILLLTSVGKAAAIERKVLEQTEKLQSQSGVLEQRNALLIENKDILDHILKTTQDGFWHLSPDGRILGVNAAYCHESGFSEAELLDMSVMDVDVGLSQSDFHQIVLDSQPQRGVLFERIHRRKDGSLWPVEVSVTFRDTGESFAFFRNLSERKKVYQALARAKESAEQSNLAKSQFLANMSHEIRTPMYGITAMLELLGTTELADKQRQLLDQINLSAESLLHIINDILDVSKLETGMVVVESHPLEINTLVQNVAEQLGHTARKKGLELQLLHLDGEPTTYLGDELRLRQVLINLVGNAIKFTPHGAVVGSIHRLERRADHDLLRFDIVDTGIGLSTEQIGHLFQPFSQADASTTRRFGGSGLGLHICKQLVTLMGGQIGVTSEPGLGSTFWFTVLLKRKNN